MFYTEVILERCNRCALNGKTRIVIRPTAKTQLVLGTNSSGKSSLLELGFSPLPPEPHNFDKPGFWSVRFHHKGRDYHCTATYGDKNEYTFSVDGGENLNRGKTITVQLELVKQYLNYDRELHNFLIRQQKSRFTMMDSNKRQNWISRFSANDFTYAFDRYNHYKREANAADKIVKYLTGELAEARKRLMDPEELQEIQSRAKEAGEILAQLIAEPKSQNQPIDPFHILADMETCITSIDQFLGTEYVDIGNLKSEEELVDLITGCGTTISTLQGELNVRAQRLTDCEQRRGRAAALMEISPEKLEEELMRLREALAELPSMRTGLHDSLLIPTGQLSIELRQIVSELPSERPEETNAVALQETIFQQQVRMGKITQLLDGLKQQQDYIHKCEEVECPDCHSKFKPGIKPGELDELKQRIENGEMLSDEAAGKLRLLEEQLVDITAVINAYRRLDTFRGVWSRSHAGLFSYFDQFGWKDLGKQLMEKLALYEGDVEISRDKTRIESAISSLEHALTTAKIEVGELANAHSEYDEALEAYNTLFANIAQVKARKQQLEDTQRRMAEWTAAAQRNEQMYERLRSVLKQYLDTLGDEMIQDLIQKTSGTLGILNAALNENDTHQMLAKDLENQLAKATIKKEAFGALAAELSPKTGLIAEQINEQLIAILSGVNQKIEDVWAYPLHISPGEANENGVDYKFPMVVDHTPRPDISAGSSSVKDIVDQVFILAGYQCMDLNDYPLFLDELGGTFDPAHRQNLIPFLKSLIDDSRFSQVLMISHQLDGQTAFPGSEIIILDDRNINFPYTYNQHVEFS